METDDLEPITPHRSRSMYLEERGEDASYDTYRTVTKGVDLFVEWCDYEGIENMNDIGGLQLNNFKSWCKNTSENNIVSLNGILTVLRRFLVFCSRIEAVGSEVPNKTPIPNVPDGVEVNREKPENEAVENVIDYLESYEPYSRRHVEYHIIKEVACRVGAIRGLDIEDIVLQKRVIKFRHRPCSSFTEKETPLKNEGRGERNVNISTELAERIQGYLNSPDRHDVKDQFDRRPLLTTVHGRPSVETIRRDLYKLTRPCVHSNECPHGRSTESCEAVHSGSASKCPSSHSPHPLRRWSIEHQIERGVSKELLSDRVDVSVPVLNAHYDTRSKERKQKHRLKVFEKVFAGYGDETATLNFEKLGDVLIDDDGMIDPQALLRHHSDSDTPITKAPAEESPSQEVVDAESTDRMSEEEESDQSQCDISQFTGSSTAVLDPLTVFIYCSVSLSGWTVGRMHRELRAISPESNGVADLSRNRIATGLAAYAVFVILLAVNFGLIGATVS